MRKKISKVILFGSALSATIAPLSTMSCGKISAKAVFWNYQDYISDDAKDGIKSSGFAYEQFGDLPEFETAIRQGNAAGGIGTDWLNATLAKNKLIKKIDFSKVFDFNQDDIVLEEELQKIYTPEAWKLMSQFDEYLDDVDGDGIKDKLYEYTIPYFMQNKVIAVNPYKVTETSSNKAFLDTLKDGDQDAINDLFSNNSWKGILSTLKNNGFNKLAINDYMRDNLMIGSENGNVDDFTSEITSTKTATDHLSGFKSTVNIFGKNNATFESSGVGNIEKILRPTTGKSKDNEQVAFAYNGDALFAYYGLWEETQRTSEVRIINPENATFLMDGFVVSNFTSSKLEDKLYQSIKENLYKGWDKQSDDEDFEEDNVLYDNFDYVNYTPAFKELHDYVETNYFEDEEGEVDEIALNMILATRKAAGEDQNKITKKTVTSVIPTRGIITNITWQYASYRASK